jgi:hypothetical protein
MTSSDGHDDQAVGAANQTGSRAPRGGSGWGGCSPGFVGQAETTDHRKPRGDRAEPTSCETAAAVAQGVVLAARPELNVGFEFLDGLPVGAVGVDPAPQAWPCPHQRLVAEVGRVTV